MNQLYKSVGISKQGHYKRLRSALKYEEQKSSIIKAAYVLRADHKRLGCRKMYGEIQPLGIGRDRTESILLDNGFRIARRRNYRRTTYAGLSWYSNKISGKQVTGVRQIWVSDITYIAVGYNTFYYLTLILDVYSRKLVGWSLSNTMKADHTVVRAYKMAIDELTKIECKQLIFHSDRGSQYVNKK